MGIQDLLITPVYLVLLTLLAYFIRPYVTNRQTKKYFLPALWIRFLGAISLGVIYQFYYSGGDTFNYWTHGSQWIYQAFQEDFSIGLKMLLDSGGTREFDETYAYSSHVWYYRDIRSYLIVRIAAFFDLFTFGTYSSTALFFSAYSFSGLWAMYSMIQKRYPESSKQIAIAILFIPSVIFWGSGILKDTVTIGSTGWLTWSLLRIIELKRYRIVEITIGIISFWLIYKVKTYILLCFFPMIAVWLFTINIGKLKSIALRILIVPILLFIFSFSGFLSLRQISKGNNKYELSSIAEQARISAYDIRYGWGARTGGDGGYDIGLPDGTWQSMIRLMPAAINVTLFRPYLWEVKNPLMLLTALESIVVLFLTGRMFIRREFSSLFRDPFLIFCLGFSLLFAFAVGVSTFNFGTLMRYKIPTIPFYYLILLIKKKDNRVYVYPTK